MTNQEKLKKAIIAYLTSTRRTVGIRKARINDIIANASLPLQESIWRTIIRLKMCPACEGDKKLIQAINNVDVKAISCPFCYGTGKRDLNKFPIR